MPAPLPLRLGRQFWKLDRRPEPAIRNIFAFETRWFSASSIRAFHSRSAVRAARPKARPNPSSKARGIRPLPTLAAGTGVLAVLLSVFQPISNEEAGAQEGSTSIRPSAEAGAPDDGLPRYRLSEVKKHGPKSSRPWVIYEDKVYDITDWIPAHPGGQVILRAAGGSVEPYWDIFSIHKTAYVKEILGHYCVGKVHPDDLRDGRVCVEDIEDPFESDPFRDPRLRQLTAKPCNAETPSEELADNFFTPNEICYVRNHMWVPVVEDSTGDSHAISIELPDGHIKTYTVGELRSKFKQHAVSALVQCSGNRRKDMTQHANKTNGLQWGVGAASNALWEGVRLRDVLADAGLPVDNLPEEAQHVQFSGSEAYGASIPIHPAVDPRGDVLLAFKMNGQPLPRDHGFPVRVVVPGIVAARWVKWVNKIVISDEESHTSWQRRDYKCFGPNETQNLDWDKYKAIQEMPVTSAITRTRVRPLVAAADQTLKSTEADSGNDKRIVELEGYAYSGGGREIQRVDVSLDGGQTWEQARLLDDSELEKGSKNWSWKRWKYAGVLPEARDKTTFVVKATDEAYNTQPQSYKSIYNLRGNLTTAWHQVEFDPSFVQRDETRIGPNR